MATYNVVRSKHATLVLAVVDTINFSDPRLEAKLVVFNRSTTGPLNFVYNAEDGTPPADPTNLGDETFVVPFGQMQAIGIPYQVTTVKIISSIAAPYSVELL